MKTSPQGRALVCASEKCYLRAYLCPAGIPTLGWGHTKGIKLGDTCSQQQADLWLTQDLNDAEAMVSLLVKVPLTQGQFDALVDFVFNLGAGKFANSTLLKLLNQGNYTAAAAQFKLWTHSGAQVLPGLVKRRAAETDMFLNSMKAPS